MIKPLSKILIILSIISSTITANFYTPINSTLDTRLLTKEGRQSVVNEVEQIKKEIKYIADKLDDFNRAIKDSFDDNKLSQALANKIDKDIKKQGLEKTLANKLKENGASNEQINEILSNPEVINFIQTYNNLRNKTDLSLHNNTNENALQDYKLNETTLNQIVVTGKPDFYDYLLKGTKAITAITQKIGESNAIATIFVTQVATQGLLKTSISLASDEIKEYFTKGIKDKLSNYIANDLFEINTNEWDNKQKQDIKTISNLSADLSVDMMIGGAYGIIKSAKKLDRVDGEFVNNVNEVSTSKIKDKDSAVNVASYEKLKADLKKSEYSAIFNKDNTIKLEFIKQGKLIIIGDKLGNKELIQELIKDNSKIKDWGKYELKLPGDNRALHYYYNSVTKKVYYDMDYKTKFKKGVK